MSDFNIPEGFEDSLEIYVRNTYDYVEIAWQNYLEDNEDDPLDFEIWLAEEYPDIYEGLKKE